MDYQSTRSNDIVFKAGQAVLEGIAPDGGLFVQRELNKFPLDELSCGLSAYGISAKVLSLLMDDFTEAELLDIVKSAYSGRFETEDVTPTVPVGDDHILELFHGPTSAFKDVALCVLPRLMTAAKKKYGVFEDTLILTATSGDTGKAALSGFMDVPGTRIIVFYPDGGVSKVQKAQMVTQGGKNVCVCAIRGNFDDAQTAVKQTFSAVEGGGLLHEHGIKLSSANSINIGRLAPQVAYYFKAYSDLLRLGRIKSGDKVDFVVPTGNFGDILAGHMAKRMGLPVGTLVCASNENNVLTDFIATGVYDRRREFHLTCSPSMDILISSNLERLLFYLSDGDAQLVATLMAKLRDEGRYELTEDMLKRLKSEFTGFCCNDEDTRRTISDVWDKYRYLMDTHTAVGYNALIKYREASNTSNPVIVLSTASPYKFPETVTAAIGGGSFTDGFAAMEALEKLSGLPAPKGLCGLDKKKVLHSDIIGKEAILDYVLNRAKTAEW